MAARHLCDFGWDVRCLTWSRASQGDERLRQPLEGRAVTVKPITPGASVQELQNQLEWCTLVVDALLGTGIKRDVEGELANIVSRVAGSGKIVVAADIPTGVDSDTGAMRGVVLPAHLTVAVGLLKYGHFMHPGKEIRGEIELEELGLDATKSREIAKGELLTEELVSSCCRRGRKIPQRHIWESIYSCRLDQLHRGGGTRNSGSDAIGGGTGNSWLSRRLAFDVGTQADGMHVSSDAVGYGSSGGARCREAAA